MTADAAVAMELEVLMKRVTQGARVLGSNRAFEGVHMSVLCMVASASLIYCCGCRREPPDLSECTRLEAHCRYGAMRYFFLGQETIFDANELAYIRSCNTWVVENPNVIRAFAQGIGKGAYAGLMWGKSTSPAPLKVVCYSNGVAVASLQVYDDRVITASGMIFRYPQKLGERSIIEPPGIQKLRLRWRCAMSIAALYIDDFRPDPNHWCDAVVESFRERRISRGGEPVRRTYSDARMATFFKCPAARERGNTDVNAPADNIDRRETRTETVGAWVSDYAMNPHCDSNSPPDTVLLFEAKAGWNQHGGPELFTFDNHDPKGGCVLLNDGTVRFIRTEEELHALRWK